NNPAILNETVWFTAYDDMPELTYFWDFGDGSTETDRGTNHIYSNVGYYNVTLTISAPIGSDIVKTKQVKVDYPKLEATIIPLGLNFTCPETYIYRVEAEGGTLEYTYEWYINEDSVSTEDTMSYNPAISNNSIIKCIVNDGNSTITVFYDLDYPPCP
ncbi:MAG: PKD domain-containing protein, partial [Phycisphaerae bacterium]|nr:PKD domain-containing protein [Phycisphaerae bacterium]